MNEFRCDVCGRFIPYSDLESGLASVCMVLPDSAYSIETWETLCKKHIESPKKSTEPAPQATNENKTAANQQDS